MSKKGRVLTSILTVVVLLAGTAFLLLRNSSFLQATTGKELANIKVEGNKVTVDLVAKETETELAPGVKMPVWTYNGTVPGQEIRVKQGQDITVNLKNELSVPATIHWHGYPVPNDQDGVPGLTQETVKPGQTFTYNFNAKMAGTYWYHSHEDSANQVGKGLAGTLIVEKNDEQQKPDKDLTVMLQEWVKPMAGMDHSNMSGMDHSQMMTQDTSTMDHMAMYNLFTVNGKSGSLIDPLKVKTGDKIRVRFINAGFQTRLMDFGNVSYKVVSTDGQDIQQPAEMKGKLLPIAAGERYDVEFTVPSSSFMIYDRTDRPAAKDIQILVENKKNKQVEKEVVNTEKFDITQYGKGKAVAASKYNKEYKLAFEDVADPSVDMGMRYTINGKSFPNGPEIIVDNNDVVKITYENKGKAVHPMHVHGHFFKVLTKNGKPVTDNIYKDTLLVEPNEIFEIELKADNPGNWMYHCHDLHHAASGMTLMVKYNGFTPSVNADPKTVKE